MSKQSYYIPSKELINDDPKTFTVSIEQLPTKNPSIAENPLAKDPELRFIIMSLEIKRLQDMLQSS